MKLACAAALLPVLLTWAAHAGAEPAYAIRYSLTFSARGLQGSVEAAAAETMKQQGAGAPDAWVLWKACPHPQPSPCTPTTPETGPSAMGGRPWTALGEALAQVAGPGFEAETSADAHRLKGTISLVLDPEELPRPGADVAIGRRVIIALASRPLLAGAPGIAASWSSALRLANGAEGYDVVSETFATVELKRCLPGGEACETHTVFQQAYPGDGVGGFDLPASILAADESSGGSLLLYLEQRLSVAPTPGSVVQGLY